MNPQTVRAWVRKAESDLKTAKDELATEEPATDTVCFHAQQCAEKYLKAFLVFHGAEIPRTHNIAELVHRCARLDASFEGLYALKAQNLTDFAVTFRYPGDVIFPSIEEAQEAVNVAEKVKAFVLDKLQQEGLQF
jgi:HEPN domain-containing protein